MLGKLAPDERFRAEVEEIQKAGEQAAALTQKLLAFSRKQMVKPRSVDLNVLVTDAEKMFERVIGEDIELITHLSPDLGQVIADPGQIHQVLLNLVVNARDAMPAGGSVKVETKNVDWDGILPYVYLGVSDTGTGMSDEVKRHLYEPFFTTKPPGKGTGLGLATVYGIIHQSGGRIEVASEPGRGTTIRIYLPRTLPVRAELAGEAVVTADLRGSETVLVVEDQDAVRQFACTILESYGYRVLQSANGPEALLLAAEYSAVIHLLVTDIILPLMDGRVLAEKLKAVRPEMKVLYISGYSEERIGHGNKIEGDLAYLSKPFTARVLAERVRKVLAAP
jgi:CheY-like chemotaxis protein